MRLTRALRGFACTALLTATGHALAQAPPEPQAAYPLTASVLTFAPGSVYWERFGHNALLLYNHRTQRTLVANYGVFDFEQENFFLNFARGQMRYRIDGDTLERTLAIYRHEQRSVTEQQLHLTPARLRQLGQFLEWNLRPENVEYRYDYFRDNCSTRVRDALDRVLGGALKAQLEGQVTDASYRSEALGLMAPIPALALAMDLALGPAADRRIDLWERSFVPGAFMAALRGVQVDDGLGHRLPLVSAERRLFEAPEQALYTWDWRLLAPPLGLAYALMLLLLGAHRHRLAGRFALAGLSALYALTAGLAGLVLLALWGLTDHWATWRNPKLLLLDPLLLLLIPGLLAGARSACRPSSLHRRVAGLCAVLAVLCLPLSAALGPIPWAWLGLLLPPVLAVAWVSRRSD